MAKLAPDSLSDGTRRFSDINSQQLRASTDAGDTVLLGSKFEDLIDFIPLLGPLNVGGTIARAITSLLLHYSAHARNNVVDPDRGGKLGDSGVLREVVVRSS